MITQPVKDESHAPLSFLEFLDGRKLAYRLSEGRLPGVVFLSGFRSDMGGAKATALAEFCRQEGIRCLRFDYMGHGQSSGDFMQGTIGGWKQDVIDMLEYVAPGPNVLVGSSMGAWLALLAALARPESVAGLVGLASAPDFTERLIWDKLDAGQRIRLEEEGVFYAPSCYGEEPYPITRHLIEDGRKYLLLDKDIPIAAPVRLVHGTCDADVPWQMSMQLMERIKSPDISLEMVKDGDHRLSYPSHLALMCRTVEEVLGL